MTTATETAVETRVLQMVRAEINVREFQRWMGGKRLVDPDHAMHCLLTECFGRPPTKEHPENDGLAPQPFRLITPRGGSTGVLYGYGRSDADALREMAGICADALQCKVIPTGKLESKPMPTSWQEGKRLGFEMRIRPVVRLKKNLARVPVDKLRRFRTRPDQDDEPRPGKECDVFQWKALQYSKGEMPESREQVYTEWLSEQLDRRGGARLEPEHTKLVSFQRVRAFRKLHDRYTEGPDALMRGELTITDPDAFADLLARGVGRHRAYGYGMLLLRPAGKSG